MLLFYHDFSFTEDVETRMETTVGGGAWLNIEDAVELTGRGEDLELDTVGAFYPDTAAADGTDDEVIARFAVLLVAVYLRFYPVETRCLCNMNHGWIG